MTNQRSAERFRVDAFVKIAGQDHVFHTRDLSEHGLFLFTAVTQAYPIKVGSTLELEIGEATFTAVVVRIVEPGTPEAESYPTGFGVRIAEISDENRAALRALITTAS